LASYDLEAKGMASSGLNTKILAVPQPRDQNFGIGLVTLASAKASALAFRPALRLKFWPQLSL